MVTDSAKNFSYVSIGQTVATGFQACFYLIFAGLLDPEHYGQISYLIAIAGVFSTVSRFGLPYTVTIYAAKENHILSNQANVMAIIATTLASIVLIPINIYAAILSFTLSSFALNQHNLLGFKKYKQYMWTAIIKSALLVALPVLLYFMFEVPGILIGMAISNFLGSLNFLKSLNTKIQSFRELRNNFKVLVNNFGVDMSLNLPAIVDKLLIVPLFGLLSVGIYQFNMQILVGLGMLPMILYSFLLPEEASGKNYKKISYITVAGSSLLALLVIIFSPMVIKQFFPKFYDGIFSLQIMIVSLVPLSFSSIFNAKLQAQESTKIGYSAIVRIVSLLGFIAIFGKLYGLVGLSIAVLLSTILYMASLYVLFQRSKR
ncbi:MAG: oligosaccharide flippase family protein [Nitrosopumilaceae archaeon]